MRGILSYTITKVTRDALLHTYQRHSGSSPTYLPETFGILSYTLTRDTWDPLLYRLTRDTRDTCESYQYDYWQSHRAPSYMHANVLNPLLHILPSQLVINWKTMRSLLQEDSVNHSGDIGDLSCPFAILRGTPEEPHPQQLFRHK
jgi:hypothetical protein